MTAKSEFLASYERIRTEHEHAKTEIDKAIQHEEECPLEAIVAYEQCLRIIDDIFKLPVELPDSQELVQKEWKDACQLIQELKALKMHISFRLSKLRKKHVSGTNATIVDSLQTVQSPQRTYGELIAGLRQLIANHNDVVSFDTLFQACTKLYRINGNRGVSTLAGETSMSVVMVNVGGEYEYLNGTFFIQCSLNENNNDEPSSTSNVENMIWMYLLVPSVTTCYRTDYGAFIFADMETSESGSAFGLILCPPSPNTAYEEQLEDLQQFLVDLLEAILLGHVAIIVPPKEPVSDRVSKGIINAADFVARNMVWGAEKTGELMMRSTPHIINRLSPAGSQPTAVSSSLQTSVEMAKSVTSAAVGVTGWVASKVGSASVAIGRYIAPHIQIHGATLLQKGFGYNTREANSKMEGAFTIAAGAMEGFSTVFNSLETSAKILGNSLSDNSVKIIEHKYGHSAANLASGTFDTIGNAFNVSQNFNYITPKGLAKKMAKNTGRALIANYQQTLHENPTESQLATCVLYPDLRNFDTTEDSQ